MNGITLAIESMCPIVRYRTANLPRIRRCDHCHLYSEALGMQITNLINEKLGLEKLETNEQL